MKANLMLAAHVLLSLMLFWSTFCRSAKSDGEQTRLSIRVSLFVLGGVSLVAMVAPFYGWWPDWLSLLMLAAFVQMQVMAAALWRDGVPHQFCNPVIREGCQ